MHHRATTHYAARMLPDVPASFSNDAPGSCIQTVDLVLSVESLKLMPVVVILEQNSEFAHGKFGDLVVDFLLTNNPLFNLVAQKHATTHRFLEGIFAARRAQGCSF
jgi:hypothetical protein